MEQVLLLYNLRLNEAVVSALFQGFLPPMLVFVQSIERARELFHELVYEGINVDVIHADRTQQQVHIHCDTGPLRVTEVQLWIYPPPLWLFCFRGTT